jgi:hypothetical protein
MGAKANPVSGGPGSYSPGQFDPAGPVATPAVMSSPPSSWNYGSVPISTPMTNAPGQPTPMPTAPGQPSTNIMQPSPTGANPSVCPTCGR